MNVIALVSFTANLKKLKNANLKNANLKKLKNIGHQTPLEMFS